MATFTTIPRDPDKGCSGIDYVLVSNWADTVSSIDTSGGAVFADGDASFNTCWTKFTVTKETSNWTETGTGSAPQASQFYNQVLNIVFGRNDTVKRNNLKALGESETTAIVVERSGNNIVLGIRNGLDMTSTNTTSGIGLGDLNGTTITLSGNECQPHAFMTDASLALITFV